MDGPWPLRFEDSGQWTCDPWQEQRVEIPNESLIPRFTFDVAAGRAEILVDALDFDGNASAWRVELLEATALEFAAPHDRKQGLNENPRGQIELAEFHSDQLWPTTMMTVDAILGAETTIGRVHQLEALPVPTRVDLARRVTHTELNSFLQGPWGDNSVYLQGAVLESVEFEPPDAHLSALVTLPRDDHLGDQRRWRFDFADVERFYLRLAADLATTDRGHISSAFVDEDHYLLVGEALTLMTQSAMVTASPWPD